MTDPHLKSPPSPAEPTSVLALYEQQPESILPLPPARGPWRADSQNGAAVGALMASLLEMTPSRVPMQPMNVSIIFARPVPFDAMNVTQRIVRDGARMQIVQSTLTVRGAECAIGTMTRLRQGESPPAERVAPPPLVRPETLQRYLPSWPYFQFVDCRMVRGSFTDTGPGAAWLRMSGQIIAGRQASALGSAMLFADAGSGLSNIVPGETWSYPNISLSIHLRRPARGDWVLLESTTHAEGVGVAQVSSTLSDLEGHFATAQQALILERNNA